MPSPIMSRPARSHPASTTFPGYALSITTRGSAAVADQPAERSSVTRRRWVAAFVGAWLVPLATHLAGADWLLPPAVLLVVVALSRAGRTVLDRVILAVAQLFGALCVAGILI